MEQEAIFTDRTDAIYARQSIDKTDSISIESQIELCRYEVRGAPCRIFSDKGYSGKNIQRPEFQRMLEQVRSGTIRRVICYKLDRCSRSIVDFANLMEEFQKYGVEFVSCTEKFDTSTPMGRAMLNICIVFAQLERETIQQRVADAYHSRSRKGFYMGGKTPFGFRRVPCLVEGKRSSRYEPEPKEAEILGFLYEKYAEAETSLADLVTLLRQRSIPNPRREDGLWVRSHIGRMLANPVYVRADLAVYHHFQRQGATICNDPGDFIGENGCYLYRQEDSLCLVLGPHKGLVSSDLWLKCRYKGTEKPLSKGPSDRERSWLTGKLTCGSCGRKLTISTTDRKNGKRYRYILCPGAHGADRCCPGLHGWKAETAEALMTKLLTEHLSEKHPLLSAKVSRQSPEITALDIRIAQLQRETEQTAAKALESGPSLLPYLDRHIRELENETQALLDRKKQHLQFAPTQKITPKYPQIWEAASSKEKRRILDALVSDIRLSEAAVTVIWNG